jgi:glyoxylate reductase
MSEPSLVLVAPELRELSGDSPDWPGGAGTAFAPPARGPGEALDARVVALIPLVSQAVGEPELKRYPALRIVANYGVGTDNLDIPAIRAYGIEVTNTPDVLTDATADLAVALLLAAARRLREGLELARSGDWDGWHPTQLLGMGLHGKVLGILGAGRIGVATARRARAFGMEIVYWDRSASVELEAETGARRQERLETLLAMSDVVSVHVPLTAETEGLIDAARLAAMKPGSILVNTARGAVLDQAAVAAALRSGHLAGAGLDVFLDEPEIPAEFRNQPTCFVLPHLGSATREARQAMWDLAAANTRAVLAGSEPLTPVAG